MEMRKVSFLSPRKADDTFELGLESVEWQRLVVYALGPVPGHAGRCGVESQPGGSSATTVSTALRK